MNKEDVICQITLKVRKALKYVTYCRMPTGMNATQRAVNTAETRLRTWLHIVARTKTTPKDYVCADDCEQHAIYGRLFNAHPLEKSPREQQLNEELDKVVDSVLESVIEEETLSGTNC